MIFHRDYETRSVIDLTKTGATKYMMHPTTEIWCASYKIDDQPAKLWLPGQPIPADWQEAHLMADEAWAHNTAFEIDVEKHLGPKHGIPEFELERQRCTMVCSFAMGLPGSLDMASQALGITDGKDMIGSRLMKQLMKPRTVEYFNGYTEIPFDAVRSVEMNDEGWEIYTHNGQVCAHVRWWNDADKVERLGSYCVQDTEVEYKVHGRVRSLPKSEWDLWHLDQKINRRGIKIDRELAIAARNLVMEAKRRMSLECSQITGGHVSALSNVNQIKVWFRNNGLIVESMAKDILEDIIDKGVRAAVIEGELQLLTDDPEAFQKAQANGPLDERVKKIERIIELRRSAGRASVSKIDALLNGECTDGRIRELLQFHAASTGRWGGRRFQPQNIARPKIDDDETLIAAVRMEDYDLIEMLYGDVVAAVADTLRGMLVAALGHRIVAADYSNIEGRDLVWLAGEDWKIDAFRQFDAGVGHDLYKVAAGGILGKDPGDITKDERQNEGKVSELAFGYQGGVGAWFNFARGAAAEYSRERVDEIKNAWRGKHAKVTDLWSNMEEAAMSAVMNPGMVFTAGGPYGRVAFKKVGSFLAMVLPSKRPLWYPYPELRWVKAPWKKKVEHIVEDQLTGKKEVVVVEEDDYRQALTYMSVIDPAKKGKLVPDPKNTARWGRISTYGGMLTENAVQAIARDVLAYAMPRLEAAGYPIVLTVHDEAVCEVPEGHGSVEEMEAIMAELPPWAMNMPVVAAGFEAPRYGKD